jgi:hypothetical protein
MLFLGNMSREVHAGPEIDEYSTARFKTQRKTR